MRHCTIHGRTHRQCLVTLHIGQTRFFLKMSNKISKACHSDLFPIHNKPLPKDENLVPTYDGPRPKALKAIGRTRFLFSVSKISNVDHSVLFLIHNTTHSTMNLVPRYDDPRLNFFFKKVTSRTRIFFIDRQTDGRMDNSKP